MSTQGLYFKPIVNKFGNEGSQQVLQKGVTLECASWQRSCVDFGVDSRRAGAIYKLEDAMETEGLKVKIEKTKVLVTGKECETFVSFG